MKRLLLTSAGLYTQSLQNRFKEFFNKDIRDVKIMFFDVASKPEDDVSYVQDELEWIFLSGVHPKNVIKHEMNSEITEEEMLKYDVIWISGGNTFYLMDIIRRTGFYKKIKNVIEKGVLYAGASAGSIVATVSLDVLNHVKMDKNIINLQDMRGINLFPIRIIPHSNRTEFEKDIAECRAKTPEEIIAIMDAQAVYVEGDKYTIISC